MKQIHQRQEHTGSYYAATVTETTDYPVLEGARSADICVVGAGFTGVATALTLAERGYGQLIHGISGLEKIRKKHGDGIADLLWDIKWRGNDIIRERVEKYAIQCDLKDGFAEVATKPGQCEWFAEFIADRERHNAPRTWETWDREETREYLGTDAFHGAFVCYRDGHLHPLNLCIGEARAAHLLGVQIFEQSPVTGIEHGAKPKVRTTSGYVEADAVCFRQAVTLLRPNRLRTMSPAASTRGTLPSAI
jgi:glycine/D-amino acid oxidase-like deaminating enzyme